MTGGGCHGNVLGHSQLQFLDLLLQRRLQVALLHRVLHEERLKDERHEDAERQQEVMSSAESGARILELGMDGDGYGDEGGLMASVSLDDDDDDHNVEEDEVDPC